MYQHYIITLPFETTLNIKQTQDKQIVQIRKDLEKECHKNFELRNGVVYRKDKGSLLFYVPSTMEHNIIRSCHDDLGHVGESKCCEAIRQTYWFPDMSRKVGEYIQNCLKCIVYNNKSGKPEGFLHNIPKGNKPFFTIHLDHCGPLEKTSRQNKHLFVVVDGFSKFIKLYACRTTSTNEVIKHLTSYFSYYSKPLQIITDRVAAGVPRANGQVERFNRSVTPMLAKLSEDPRKWDLHLTEVEFALNNSVNISIGE